MTGICHNRWSLTKFFWLGWFHLVKIKQEEYFSRKITFSVLQLGALPEDVDQGFAHNQIVEDFWALVAPCLINAHKISAINQNQDLIFKINKLSSSNKKSRKNTISKILQTIKFKKKKTNKKTANFSKKSRKKTANFCKQSKSRKKQKSASQDILPKEF